MKNFTKSKVIISKELLVSELNNNEGYLRNRSNINVNLTEKSLLPLKERDVIKNPKCNYNNDVNYATTYYFCQCSEDLFYPVCSSCAVTCHKNHKPTLKMTGIYECQCGIHNHNVDTEHDIRLKNRKENSSSACIFTKLIKLKQLENTGFYYYSSASRSRSNSRNNTQNFSKNLNDLEKNIYCIICVESCLNKKPDNLEKVKIEDYNENTICACENHYEFNPINSNLDFMGKYSFLENNLLNFSVNSLYKINEINSNYHIPMASGIKAFENKSLSSPNTFKEFDKYFSDVYIIKAIDLFIFFKRLSNKNTFINDRIFSDIRSEVLLKMIDYEPMIVSYKIHEYLHIRIKFAELIYYNIIKNFIKMNFTRFNLNTILNMTLTERQVFLNNYSLNKLNSVDKNDFQNKIEFVNDFASSVIKLFEIIMKNNENFNFKRELVNEIFSSFVFIFKNLIKYNLIDDSLKNLFFKISLEVLTIKLTLSEKISMEENKEIEIETNEVMIEEDKSQTNKNTDNLNIIKKDSAIDINDEEDKREKDNNENIENTINYVEINIVKSSLYYIIQQNDKVVIEKINNGYENSFSFEISQESKNLTKVVLLCLNNFNKFLYPKRVINSFDNYVKAIFDIMISHSRFYLQSIKNSCYENTNLLMLMNNSKVDIESDIRDVIKNLKIKNDKNKWISCGGIGENLFENFYDFNYKFQSILTKYYYNSITIQEFLGAFKSNFIELREFLESKYNFNSFNLNWASISNNNPYFKSKIRDFNSKTSYILKYSYYRNELGLEYKEDEDNFCKVFRNTICFTKFYVNLDCFFKTYTESLFFLNIKKKYMVTGDLDKYLLESNNLVFILKILALSIENSFTNINLVSTISSKNLVSIFLDFIIIEEFWHFISFFSKTLFKPYSLESKFKETKTDDESSNLSDNKSSLIFNNHSFFYSILNQIILRINFDDSDKYAFVNFISNKKTYKYNNNSSNLNINQNISSIEVEKKSIYLLYNVLNIIDEMLSLNLNLTLDNTGLIDILNLLFQKIDQFRYTQFVIDSIDGFKIELINKKKITNSTFKIFFSLYIKVVNKLINYGYSDLLNFMKDENLIILSDFDFLTSFTDYIFESSNKNDNYIDDYELYIEIFNFITMRTFNFVNSQSTKDKAELLLAGNISDINSVSNLSFLFQEKNDNIQSRLNRKYVAFVKNLNFSNFVINRLSQKAQSIQEEQYLPHQKLVIIKKIYEHLLFRPIYHLLNDYIIYIKFLTGSNIVYIYNAAYEFIKSTLNMIVKLNIIEERFIDNQSEYCSEEKALFYSEILLNLNEITLDKELQENEDFLNDLINILEKYINEVKYYDLLQIKNVLYSVFKKVKLVKIIEEENKSEVNESLFNIATIMNTFQSKIPFNLKFRDKLKEKDSDYDIRKKIYDALKFYETRIKNVFEGSLALVNSIEDSEEHPFGEMMFKYVINKLYTSESNIKEENLEKLFYKPTKLSILDRNLTSTSNKVKNRSENSIHQFIYQNSWVIELLNKMIYHSASTFQGLLEKEIEDEEDIENNNPNTVNTTIKLDSNSKYLNFYDVNNYYKKISINDLIHYLTMNIAFVRILRKLSNPFSLNSNYLEISSVICNQSIKLLQNLCEGHNQFFQNRFFNFQFSEERIKTIIYNEEFAFYGNDTIDEKYNFENFKSEKFSIGFGDLLKNKLVKELKDKGDILNIFSTGTNQGMFANLGSSDNNNQNIKGGKKQNLAQIVKNKKQIKKNQELVQKELQELKTYRKSFINFSFIQIQMISKFINQDISENFSEVLEYNNDYISDLEEINQRLIDLIVEMIQGTKTNNFNFLYKKLPESIRIIDGKNNVNHENQEVWEAFRFANYLYLTNESLFSSNLKVIFNDKTIESKINAFSIINNIINQDVPEDNYLIRLTLGLFEPEKILNLLTSLLKGIFIKYVLNINYCSYDFKKNFDDFEFDLNDLHKLKEVYINDLSIYDDNYFKLASSMYLYLTNTHEKYEMVESTKVISLSKQELYIHKTNDYIQSDKVEIDLKGEGFGIFQRILKLAFGFEVGPKNEYVKSKVKFQNENNNKIITIRFFEYITKKLEFMIDSSNDEGNDLTLKRINWIMDPKTMFISQNNFNNFYDEVDRTSSTTKLKGLIEKLPYFETEVSYKYNNIQTTKSEYLKFFLEIDYKRLDLMNFIISLFINLTLLLSLTKSDLKGGAFFKFILLFVALQLILNLTYLTFFLISKYNYYVMLETQKILETEEKQNLNLIDKIKVYVLDSLLLNEEIYLIFMNIIIPIIAISSSYSSFLFSIQLLTVIKFVPTINEIVRAFRMRIFQLLSMIGFLSILIFFYSNLGFYFLNDDFDTELKNVRNIFIRKT
jgi:hypothetical protein